MSVQPLATSIQTAYRWFRNGQLRVNRTYQRKLVWTNDEKVRLVESILKEYPIPQFILARVSEGEEPIYEIIDGMQRLNAIFSFIELNFSISGKYFDYRELPRARQAAEDGEFKPSNNDNQVFLDKRTCANFTDYNLAVTVFPAEEESRIIDVFGRINSNGRQLSDQDRRQAGAVGRFNEIVRTISATIRGDETRSPIDLRYMPSISIDIPSQSTGNAVKAAEVFWCRHGIARTSELRQSVDEQIVAELLASVLLTLPIKNERSDLDAAYATTTDIGKEIEEKLAGYEHNDTKKRFISVIDEIEAIVRSHSSASSLRQIVYPKGSANPIRAVFHALFCALYRLMFSSAMRPVDHRGISIAIENLHASIEKTRGGISPKKRDQNIKKVIGLIQEHFQRQVDTAPYTSGIHAGTELRNSLIRCASEIGRFELKQGVKNLDVKRSVNRELLSRLIETACAIANSNPEDGGMIIIGVADSEADAARICEMFPSTKPEKVGNFYVVGIEHEAENDIHAYYKLIVDTFRNSELSEPLKSTILGAVDCPKFNSMTLVKINVPQQSTISTVGENVFFRSGNSTEKATPKQAAELQRRFR